MQAKSTEKQAIILKVLEKIQNKPTTKPRMQYILGQVVAKMGKSTGTYVAEIIDSFDVSKKYTITYPDTYTIEKSSEAHRRGSYMSYDFYKKTGNGIFLQEIQFFSATSISEFAKKCEIDGMCFEGDYPTLERYNAQKEAFAQQQSYEKYVLKTFGNRSYFVSNTPCIGDSCIVREYTTFIEDTKIDIRIMMRDDSQIEEADAIFENIHI